MRKRRTEMRHEPEEVPDLGEGPVTDEEIAEAREAYEAARKNGKLNVDTTRLRFLVTRALRRKKRKGAPSG